MYPVCFNLNSIPIGSFLVCQVLAAAVTTLLSRQEALRLGLPLRKLYLLIAGAALAFALGSHLFYVLVHWRYHLAHPWEILDLLRGGLMFQGGLLAAMVVIYGGCRLLALPWRAYLDVLAVGFPLGHAIGRVGCFLGGCCYGRPTSLPWAVTYTYPYAQNPPRGIPLHPVQLYEALWVAGIFAVIYAWRRRKHFDGELALMYLGLAGGGRFFLEFFRAPQDYRGPVLWGLPLTQLIALGQALLSLTLWLWARTARTRGESLPGADTLPPGKN
jgi:phosphatidylglycerol:prolipoprotein diacylglycerol transferase